MPASPTSSSSPDALACQGARLPALFRLKEQGSMLIDIAFIAGGLAAFALFALAVSAAEHL